MLCFFLTRVGLGYGYEAEYVQLDDIFVGNSKRLTQAKISGEIVCKEYKNLSEFINFVETSKTIKIKYKIQQRR